MNHRTARLLVVAALTAAAVLGLAGPSSARVIRPPASYYGMHYAAVNEGTWPQARIGSIRLWDTGTMWRDVEPAPGVFDWTRLDAAVANAERHGATIDLVLGGTPQWAAENPTSDAAMYPAGSNSPPRNMDDYWVYVHAVAARYAGRIGSYEPVNEPNVPIFWVGSWSQLALMARTARAAVRTVDARALLVSPSPALRGDWVAWIRAYAATGVYHWADVVGVHNYPTLGQTVADGMRKYDRVQALLRSLGVRKPMWDTETNMETNTGRALMGPHAQARMLTRYYERAWRHGVWRVYWYDWSSTSNIGVRVAASPGSTRPSLAGLAFTAVQGR